MLGFNVLLQWQDPDAILDLHYAAVATGWGSEGDWIVCLPESCMGYHDAMEATGTDGTDGSFAGIAFEGPEVFGDHWGDGTGAEDFSGAGVRRTCTPPLALISPYSTEKSLCGAGRQFHRGP